MIRFLSRVLPSVGTRSVLYGAHCFFIHPFFVAEAWRRIYGFPWDPRLWVAFFVHDLGYVGKPNMDGPEGERHVEWGAALMGWLFDWPFVEYRFIRYRACSSEYSRAVDFLAHIDQEDFTFVRDDGDCAVFQRTVRRHTWRDFCLYHSRFYAKRDGQPHSRLCVADKLAMALEPWWLYLPRVWASGEVWEYMRIAGGTEGSKYNGEPEVGKHAPVGMIASDASLSRYQKLRRWHRRCADYMGAWAWEHQDGRLDLWTPPVVSASETAAEVVR